MYVPHINSPNYGISWEIKCKLPKKLNKILKGFGMKKKLDGGEVFLNDDRNVEVKINRSGGLISSLFCMNWEPKSADIMLLSSDKEKADQYRGIINCFLDNKELNHNFTSLDKEENSEAIIKIYN